MRRPPPIFEIPRFPVTGGTILLAIGVSLAYWGKADIAPLLADANVRRWELWRLLSSALPHANLFHLIFNLYWMWTFGSLVEDVLGHLKTGLIFVFLAMGSSAAQFALMDGGIGLSGVGYGLFGMLWVLSHQDRRFEDAVDKNTTVLFIVWFFICIALTESGTMPVANVAHGVGAVMGFLLGWAIAGKRAQRGAAIAASAVLLLGSLLGATIARPWINLSHESFHDEFRLGYAALAAGQNEKALRWFTDVTRMAPYDAAGWYDLSLANARLGREDAARAAAERAHQLAPNDEQTGILWQRYRHNNAATMNSN